MEEANNLSVVPRQFADAVADAATKPLGLSY